MVNERRGIHARTLGKINEPAVLSEVEQLPQVLGAALAHPLQTHTERGMIGKVLGEATLLPPNAKALRPTWELLHSTLQTGQGDTRFAAFLVADFLMHQISLPTDQKYFPSVMGSFDRRFLAMVDGPFKREQVRQRMSSYQTALGRQPVDQETEGTRKKVVEEIEGFKKEMDDIFDDPDDTRESVKKRLEYLDTLGRFGANKSAFLIFWSQSKSEASEKYGSPFGLVTKLASVSRSPHAASLLIDGEIADIEPGLQQTIWTIAMVANSKSYPNSDEADSTGLSSKLVNYFLEDMQSDLRESFWEVIADSPLISSHSHQDESDEIKKNSRLAEAYSPYAEFENFLLQDPETIERLFETIPLASYSGSKLKDLLRRLTGIAGVFQTVNPNHPNAPHLRRLISTLADSHRANNAVENALSILTDESPGVLFADKHDRIRTRKDEFDRPEPNKLILYVSQKQIVPVPESGSTQKPDATGELRLTRSGESQFLRYWGEVQVPAEKAVHVVVEHVVQRFKKTKPKEDKLTEQFSSLQNEARKSAGKDPVVVPALLSTDHQLYALNRAGVIAIVPQEDGFLLMIDAVQAGIQTDGPNIIAIPADLDNVNDLFIKGVDMNSFSYTPLHLALTNAALLTRKPFTPQSVSRDEAAELKATVKNWNQRGKERGWPTLSYQDVSDLDPKDTHALTILGKKSELLTLQPSNGSGRK